MAMMKRGSLSFEGECPPSQSCKRTALSSPANGKGRVFVSHTKFPFLNICSIYSSVYPPHTGSCEKRPPVDVYILRYGEHSPN